MTTVLCNDTYQRLITTLDFFSLLQDCKWTRSWQLLLRAAADHPGGFLRGFGHRSPIPPLHLERVFTQTLIRGHAHPHHHCRVFVFYLYGSRPLDQTVNTRPEPKWNSDKEQTVKLEFRVYQKAKLNDSALKEIRYLKMFKVSFDECEGGWDFRAHIEIWLALLTLTHFCVCDYYYYYFFNIADDIWHDLLTYIW